MPVNGPSIALTANETVQIPNSPGVGTRIVSGIIVANLSPFALQLQYGAHTQWVSPFQAWPIPQSQLGQISVTAVPIGGAALAGTLLPTYYFQGEPFPTQPITLNATAALYGLATQVEGIGGATFDSRIYNAQGTTTTWLLVQEHPPLSIAVFEALMSQNESVTLIPAGPGKSTVLRRIHVGCWTVAPAANFTLLQVGISAGDASLGSFVSPVAGAFVPQDFDYEDMAAADAENTAVVITNASTDAAERGFAVALTYTQSTVIDP